MDIDTKEFFDELDRRNLEHFREQRIASLRWKLKKWGPFGLTASERRELKSIDEEKEKQNETDRCRA